jgi:hypothetical protein
MKRSFILALVLMTATIIGFSGCDSAIGPGVETAVLNNARAAAVLNANGPGTLEAVTITGPLAVVDGAYAVLYQGSPWYVNNLSRLADTPELTEGATATVMGERSPILDQDSEGNSLFLGYYLTVENLSVN